MSFFSSNNIYNRSLTKVFDLCLISILTCLLCVPIITSATALTSMYAMMMKLYKNQEGSIIASYIREFKSNFRSSVIGSVILVAGLVLFSFDLVAWTQNNIQGRSIWYGATLVVMAVFITVFDWYLCIRARFVESFTQAVSNATRFTFIYLPISVAMGAYTILIGWLVTKFAFLLFFFPVIGFVVLCFPKAILIGRRIDKYIEDEGLSVPGPTPEESLYESVTEDDEAGDSEKNTAYRDLTQIKREEPKMTLADRLSYIWFNHIAAIIFGAIFIAVVGGVAYNFVTAKTCEFALAVVNSYSERTDTELSEELDEYYGLDGDKHYAYVDTGYQLAYKYGDTIVDNTVADESFYEKFFLNIRNGAMDAAIIPMSFYEYCNSVEDMFFDIEYVLGSDGVDKYEKYLVKGSGDYSDFYRGIIIDDSDYLKKSGITFIDINSDEPYVLVFPTGSRHKNNIIKFVDYLNVVSSK